MGLNTRLKENIIGETNSLYPHISYDEFSTACKKEDAAVEDIYSITYMNFALIIDRLSKDKKLNETIPYIDESEFYKKCEETWMEYISTKKVCEFSNYEQLYAFFNNDIVTAYEIEEEKKKKSM